MPDDEAPPNRSAWPLTSIIVAVLLLTMLGWMILPVLGSVRGPSRQSNCGKNMSQLMGALIAYSTGEDNAAWPTYTGMPKRDVMDARSARQATCRMFAMLVRQQSIPMSVFQCPQSGNRPPPGITGAEVPVDWGLSDAGVLAYAFDWASPPDPSSGRVIMADRNPMAHGDGAFACFGDAHVKRLRRGATPPTRSAGTLVTEGMDGKPIPVSIGNPDAGGDDIYSTEGDGGDPLTPGKGDPLRAWVK